MEKAFGEVFLRALSRALRDAISHAEVKEQFALSLKTCIKSGAISPDLIEENIDEVAISCLGALSADVSLRSMFERDKDPLQETKKLVTEELVRVAGDQALDRLLNGCQMEQAISQFGEEKLEDIVERISTQDIYLRPEFEESLASLRETISAAMKG